MYLHTPKHRGPDPGVASLKKADFRRVEVTVKNAIICRVEAVKRDMVYG
jgi:hypothetical protein